MLGNNKVRVFPFSGRFGLVLASDLPRRSTKTCPNIRAWIPQKLIDVALQESWTLQLNHPIGVLSWRGGMELTRSPGKEAPGKKPQVLRRPLGPKEPPPLLVAPVELYLSLYSLLAWYPRYPGRQTTCFKSFGAPKPRVLKRVRSRLL